MIPTKLQKAMTRHRLTLKIATDWTRARLDAAETGQRMDVSAELAEARQRLRNAVRVMGER
jgi:hypothetical protein